MNSWMMMMTCLWLIVSDYSSPASAHFFTTSDEIPPSLIPNTTTWDAFSRLAGGCKGRKNDGLPELKRYFKNFGYLDGSSDFSDEFDDSFESAVRTYQLNFNLNATGELDEPTLNHIVRPRCGGPDVVNGVSTMLSGGGRRESPAGFHTVGHYSFFPGTPRWPANKRRLTYAFQPANQLSDAVKALFERSFHRWANVTPLTFVETAEYRSADIRIGFYRGEHGDGEAFDGLLGTLAHAFAPPLGLFHLDGDENWVTGGEFTGGSPSSAIDLETVAVHEIGHVLGLGHSSVQESIMYPTIVSGTRKVELQEDDITGIQVLYGSNPNNNGSVQNPTQMAERETNSVTRITNSWLLESNILTVVGLILIFI